MRIHSKYRDYYDVGLTYGVDPDLHYLRKEISFSLHDVSVEIPKDILDGVERSSTSFQKREIKRFALGFCGTIYPGVTVYTRTGKLTLEGNSEILKECVYSPARLLELFPNKEHLSRRERRSRKFYTRYGKLFGLNKTTEHLCNFVRPRTGFDKLFIELSTVYKGEYVPAPVFVLSVGESYRHKGRRENLYFDVNAHLADYNFAKVKDPVTAFQEISMYLGNQLTHVEEPLQISDKDMIVEKGFDLKSSFRHPVKFNQL